jgi:hypothetical protein
MTRSTSHLIYATKKPYDFNLFFLYFNSPTIGLCAARMCSTFQTKLAVAERQKGDEDALASRPSLRGLFRWPL